MWLPTTTTKTPQQPISIQYFFIKIINHPLHISPQYLLPLPLQSPIFQRYSLPIPLLTLLPPSSLPPKSAPLFNLLHSHPPRYITTPSFYLLFHYLNPPYLDPYSYPSLLLSTLLVNSSYISYLYILSYPLLAPSICLLLLSSSYPLLHLLLPNLFYNLLPSTYSYYPTPSYQPLFLPLYLLSNPTSYLKYSQNLLYLSTFY